MEICVSKSIRLALQLEGNLPFLLCFTLYLRAISKYGAGAYIWKGDLTEAFLRYEFRGLILGGAYTWRGVFTVSFKRFSCPHRHLHTPRTCHVCTQNRWVLKLMSIDVIQHLPCWDGTRLDGTGFTLLFFFISIMLAMISPAIIPCRLASHGKRRFSIIYNPAVLCAHIYFIEKPSQ